MEMSESPSMVSNSYVTEYIRRGPSGLIEHDSPRFEQYWHGAVPEHLTFLERHVWQLSC